MSRFICGVWTVLNPERPISTPMHTEITFNHSQLQSVWWLQQRIGTRCCLLEQPESGFFVNHEYWILHPTDASADQITCKKQTRSLEDIKPNSRQAATVPVVAVHMAPRQKGIKHVYKYSKYLAYRLPAVCPQCRCKAAVQSERVHRSSVMFCTGSQFPFLLSLKSACWF